MRRAVPAVVFAFAVFLFAPAAQAEIIAGGSVGQANLEFDLDDDFSFDEGDTGWKVYGGFRFFKFFGVGASYIDFGVPEDTLSDVEIAPNTIVDVDLEVDVTAWDVYAEGVLPLGSRFEVFAKVGYVIWDVEIAGNNVAGVEDDDSGSDFAYGAGAAFKFAKLIAVRLEYQVFEVEDTKNVDFASVGLDFRF
jgi:OOP family OmpA-OmpF porin